MKNQTSNTFFYLFFLAVGTFTLGVSEFMPMAVLPSISDGLSASTETTSLVVTFYAAGVIVGTPLFMFGMATVNRKAVLLTMASLMAIGNLVSGLSNDISILIASRFLSGIPHGAFFGTAFIVASKLAPQEKQSLYISYVFLGLTSATLIAVPFSPFLTEMLDWQSGFFICSFLAFVVCAGIFFLFPPFEVGKNTSYKSELSIFRNKLVWCLILLVILGFAGVFCIYTFLAENINEVINGSFYHLTLALFLFGVGSVLGNWICGKLGDRAPFLTLVCYYLLSVGVAACYTFFGDNLVLVFVAITLVGMNLGTATIIQSLLFRTAPNSPSMAGAIVQCAFNGANALGPALGGLVFLYNFPANYTGLVAATLFAIGATLVVISFQVSKRSRSVTI